MPDPRIAQYARLLVERCIDVQPGQQVMVTSSPLARDLVEEVVRAIARRGAYALVRLNYASISSAWASEAPIELVGQTHAIDTYTYEKLDALISIGAPENTRDGSDLGAERSNLLRQSQRLLYERMLSFKMPWVGCEFPTQAQAQDAGMTLREFEDFLYGACLLDWDAEGRKMRHLADRFDAATAVRIVGEGTDLTMSLEGRNAMIDDGHLNMPGGEFFYSPVETSAEGVITYSEFPAVYAGYEVEEVRLRFAGGTVVEATARTNQDFLRNTLATDAGASVLGELGIGCNPGIQRHMKNTLFDEKIYGTVHLALGNGFPLIGGKNVSHVHWDMVKDLRQGGQMYCDDQLVQENGRWLI